MKFFNKKNKKKNGFTRTPILALLHSFFNIFYKKFRTFFFKRFWKIYKQCNKKTMPKLVCGFTLVETLVAVSIFSLSAITLLSFLSTNISTTGYAKNKMIATYLAQEGIEYFRNMRDTYVLYPVNGGWNGFKDTIASCVSENGCGFDSSVDITNSVFQCSSAQNSRCKLYIDNGNYNTNYSGVDSGFTRVILRELVGGGTEEVKITSTVYWNTGSTPHSVSFSENLFNWVELE